MKALVLISCFFFSFSVFADCGLEGSFEERVASCNKVHKTLKLVMSKLGEEYWFNPKTKSIFQIAKASSWSQAQANCKAKKLELSLPDPLYDWGLSISREISIEITEVYPDLNISETRDEKRYWLGDLYDHPTGKKWAAFYSTRGFIDRWFQDAGDAWYIGGICSLVLK